MKFIGQHIFDFIARFRDEIYLEDISTGTIASGGNLGLDSNNKIVKADTEAGELTIANATDNRVVTSLGGTDLNAEANLTFSGSAFNATATSAAFTNTASFIVAADSGPGFILSNTANDSNGPVLTLRNTRGGSDASDGDGLGTISFIGNDDGTPSEQTYAQIIATSPDVSNSAEEGQLEFKVASHDGELQPGLIIDSGNVEDEVDVVLGNGSSSTTRLAGKLTHNSILTVESGSTTSFNPNNQNVQITTDATDGLTGPTFLINSNSDQVNGPEIKFNSSRSSNAFVASDNDRIGNILMSGMNDAGNLFTGAHDYAQIIGTIADATAGQEAGDLKLKVASYDGVLTDGLQLLGDTNADGEVDVTIASGAASTTTVSGNLQVNTGIELGHASDTTIARSAAGTVTIEGNQVVTAAVPAVSSGSQAPLALHIARKTLNTGEAHAIASVPAEVIPAQGANTVIQIVNAIARVDRALTQSVSSVDMNFHYEGHEPGVFGTSSLAHARRFMWNVTTDEVVQLTVPGAGSANVIDLTKDVNKAVEVSFDATPTINCFTSIDIFVTYYVYSIA